MLSMKANPEIQNDRGSCVLKLEPLKPNDKKYVRFDEQIKHSLKRHLSLPFSFELSK